MTRIIDDFDAIRARLAELRGETSSGGTLEFNADELVIISDVSVPLSSLRIEAELDAEAYKRGAEEVAEANRKAAAAMKTAAGFLTVDQVRALEDRPVRRVPVYRDGPKGEPEIVRHEEWSEEDIRRYWREAVQKAETKTAKFERGLRTLNEALARGALATARHSELVALTQERYGFLTVSQFTAIEGA